jgi:hypothetical protein
MVEIYNEKVFDLLHEEQKRLVRVRCERNDEDDQVVAFSEKSDDPTTPLSPASGDNCSPKKRSGFLERLLGNRPPDLLWGFRYVWSKQFL